MPRKGKKLQKAALKVVKLSLAGSGQSAYTIRRSLNACKTDYTDI